MEGAVNQPPVGGLDLPGHWWSAAQRGIRDSVPRSSSKHCPKARWAARDGAKPRREEKRSCCLVGASGPGRAPPCELPQQKRWSGPIQRSAHPATGPMVAQGGGVDMPLKARWCFLNPKRNPGPDRGESGPDYRLGLPTVCGRGFETEGQWERERGERTKGTVAWCRWIGGTCVVAGSRVDWEKWSNIGRRNHVLTHSRVHKCRASSLSSEIIQRSIFGRLGRMRTSIP